MYAPAVLESKTRVTTDQDVGRKAITRIRCFALPRARLSEMNFPKSPLVELPNEVPTEVFAVVCWSRSVSDGLAFR